VTLQAARLGYFYLKGLARRGVMIERDFYPLAMASEITDCSVDDLLNLGASGRITIHAMTNGLFGRINTTVGSVKTEEIFQLPDASEILAPTLLKIANGQAWRIESVLITGKCKMSCIPLNYTGQGLYWYAPFARAKNNFDRDMCLRDGVMPVDIEIKDFLLAHSELEKAKTFSVKPLSNTPVQVVNSTEQPANARTNDNKELTDNERYKLLRVIGLLAETLADTQKQHLRNPDGSIAIGNGEQGKTGKTNLIKELLNTAKSLSESPVTGLGKTILQDTIKAGVNALHDSL